METMTLVLVAAAGLVLGSFFNVVIYRLPRGLSLVKPPSSCPECGAPVTSAAIPVSAPGESPALSHPPA